MRDGLIVGVILHVCSSSHNRCPSSRVCCPPRHRRRRHDDSLSPRRRHWLRSPPPTDADHEATRIIEDIATCVNERLSRASSPAVAARVGVAEQVDMDEGVVRTAPNLGWTNVPLQSCLEAALDLPAAVANDVRSITRGVWHHGAGRGVEDLACSSWAPAFGAASCVTATCWRERKASRRRDHRHRNR